MRFLSFIPKFTPRKETEHGDSARSRLDEELRARTRSMALAKGLEDQTRSFELLFRVLWTASSEFPFLVRLVRWINLMEQDDLLRRGFQESFLSMLAGLYSVSLLSEAGLPMHHAIASEGVRRIVQRLLPSAREESDSSRLLILLFSGFRDLDRLRSLPDPVFERLYRVLWPADPSAGVSATALRLRQDAQQALCLMAARTAGRGMTSSMRERGRGSNIEDSPFYQLIFATENLVRGSASGAPNSSTTDGSIPGTAGGSIEGTLNSWRECVGRCHVELNAVYLKMEHSGVSADLILDLRSIEMTLARMGQLADLLAPDPDGASRAERGPAPALHALLCNLVEGRLEDRRVRSLLRQNLNMLARKTVEHTGRSGEHYIAHSMREYWQMWAAAAGGGLLTVLTAAFKMRIIEQNYPLFVQGFLSSANYAISFILLQVFGLALATKQPSATAAAFAGIVRRSRGRERWSKISDFSAHIARTQLAAAFSNVIAVCVGAVALERLWRIMFSQSYLPAASAKHVYETLHPFASGTIVFAAATGVLLWMAALIGGWCENFAFYHRIPDAIAQHPLGTRVGRVRMERAARWLELRLSGWSTSIALGFLLGFFPVIGSFFGVPLDVRHVTLSTGTLALAAARYGTSSFGHDWFYYAVAGIAITFVLNLSVSFLIAAYVALRAYDVPAREQLEILRFVLREIARSPLKFVFPVSEATSPMAELQLTEFAEKK